MASYKYLMIVIFIGIQIHLNLADAEFPFVEFEDYPPYVYPETTKTFTTTLGVISCHEAAVFNEEAFYGWVTSYYQYGAGLEGYEELKVTAVTTADNLTLVIFDTRYNYSILITTPGISDQLIQNTIGSYEHVVMGIGNSSCLLPQRSATGGMHDSVAVIEDAFNFNVIELGSGNASNDSYYFPNTSKHFQFSGSALCSNDKINCNATHITCNETLDGVNVSCTSSCKFGLCLNGGNCKQENPNTNPLCTCPSSYDSWLVGERCQTLVEQWMFILFLVLTGLVLIAICCLVIAMCLFHRKKRPQANLHPDTYKDQAVLEEPVDPNQNLYQQTERYSSTATTRKYSERSTASDETIEKPIPKSRRRQQPSSHGRYRDTHRSRNAYYRSSHARSYDSRVTKPKKVKVDKPVRRNNNANKVYLALNSMGETRQYTTKKRSSHSHKVAYGDKPVNKKPSNYNDQVNQQHFFPQEIEAPSPPIKWLQVENDYDVTLPDYDSTGFNNTLTDESKQNTIRWLPAKTKPPAADYVIKKQKTPTPKWKTVSSRKNVHEYENSYLGDTNV